MTRRRTTRKRPSQYHHGSLREAALEAAANEIDAHGHVAFSMERVARSLGVTPAALYRHFEGRQALLREVCFVWFEKYLEAMDAVARAPAADPLLEIGRTYVRYALANPGWFRLQFSRAGAEIADRQAKADPHYAEVMRREIAAAVGDDPPIGQRWALTFWALVHGAAAMCIEHVVPGLPADDDRLALADLQLETFLGAMRAGARR